MTPGNRKRVGEFLILFLYLIIEGYGLWPVSHFWALAAGVAGFFALLMLDGEFSGNQIGAYTSLAIAGCTFVYFIVAPIPPPARPEPRRGWLQAANDPTPENPCGQNIAEQFGEEAELIIIGPAAFVMSGRPEKMDALLLGNCPITLSSGPNGVAVDAQIYDQSGVLVGTLKDNGYTINSESGIVTEVSGDLSTLVVHKKDEAELLYVRYLNDHAIRMRGVFTCPTPRLRTITVTNTTISPLGPGPTRICATRSKGGTGRGMVFH